MHRLDLANGSITRIDELEARTASLSPNGQTLAIAKWVPPMGGAPHQAHLLLSRPDGTEARVTAEIKNHRPRRNYAGMGAAPTQWSPRGDLIVLPAETSAWLVKVPEQPAPQPEDDDPQSPTPAETPNIRTE